MAARKCTHADKAQTGAVFAEKIRQDLRMISTTGAPGHNAVACFAIVQLEFLRELLDELNRELVADVRLRGRSDS